MEINHSSLVSLPQCKLYRIIKVADAAEEMKHRNQAK